MTGKNRVVVAGAGTGKTHALVEHYLLCLLGLDGAETRRAEIDAAAIHEGRAGALGSLRSPDQILAITFTDKAAAEMRARVQRRLASLLFDPGAEPTIIARARAANRTLDTPVERRALEELRRAMTGAPILTFHAFCGRTLREHALALGIDPSFTVLDAEEERRLLAETAEACVIDLLARGSSACAELVARMALHGFGERKGLVECLVDLHATLAERGLAPSGLPLAADRRRSVEDALAALDGPMRELQALARSTGGKAAERTAAIDDARRALAAVWHGGHDDNEDSDREAALARAFMSLRECAGGNWGGKALSAARHAMVHAVDEVGAALVDAATSELAPVVRELLVELGARQEREKHVRGFLAFGDLLLHTRNLLRDVPAVRAAVKGRFARVLVDEYQDTSPVQEDVLALLLEEPSRGAAHTHVSSRQPGAMWEHVRLAAGRGFLVGDPKQSIYGFRGADAGVFERALAVVGSGDAGERAELSTSWRSRAPVVELANLVATHALSRGPFGVDRALVVPLRSARGGDGAAGARWTLGAPDELGGDVGGRAQRDAAVVASGVAGLVRTGACRARDVAVLVRRSSAAVPISRALSRAGIHAVVVGGDGFYARPEVADIIGALGLAIDADDEVGVWAILRSPLVAVPDDQILALYEGLPRARGLTWPRALEAAFHPRIDGDVRERIRRFDAVLSIVQNRLLEPQGKGSAVARAIDVLLDEGHYAAACGVEPDARLRLENLEKLRAMVESATDSAFVTVGRLVQALADNVSEPLAATLGDAGPEGDADDAVRIMTIHQSKGLEFPVVVLADAAAPLRAEADDLAFDPDVGLAVTERGRPIAACVPRARAEALTGMQRVRRRARERGEAELARLLYVALTRARDGVFVVDSPHRAGRTSLLGILDDVQASAPDALDALLPTAEVPIRVPGATPMTALPPQATSVPWVLPAPMAPKVRRVRASQIASRLRPQPELQLGERTADDDEGLPRRAAGRLAHSILGLVVTEAPDALTGHSDALESLVVRAARAFGVPLPPDDLVRRCVLTLTGPVLGLLREGFVFSAEEPLRVERSGVVVEGRADLVARRADRTVVVELKLSAAARASPAALLQVSTYAAALDAAEEPDVHTAVWVLGDQAPSPPQRWDRAGGRRLDEALARLAPLPHGEGAAASRSIDVADAAGTSARGTLANEDPGS